MPQNAGVLSAFGLLAADYTQYETVTRKMPLDDAAPDAVREVSRQRCAASLDVAHARGRHGRAI